MRKQTKQKEQPLFSDEEVEKLLNGVVRSHMELTKWLYDNYREILREYEKTKGNLRIHFLNEAKEFKTAYNKYVRGKK